MADVSSSLLLDVPLLPTCQEEVPERQERSCSLVQVKPEAVHIKDEQEEEHLQRPEDADGSWLTLHGVIYGSGYVLQVENAGRSISHSSPSHSYEVIIPYSCGLTFNG